MCGFGIDTSVASYEEVMNAKANQNTKPKADEREVIIERIKAMLQLKEINPQDFYAEHNLTTKSSLEELQSAMRVLMG